MARLTENQEEGRTKPLAISYGDGFWSDQGMLLCPACGESYIHHGDVYIFNRQEDADSGTSVFVTGDEVHVTSDMKGNLSSRRHGLRIRFWCENCDQASELILAQHKGNTFIWMYHWTDPDRAADLEEDDAELVALVEEIKNHG